MFGAEALAPRVVQDEAIRRNSHIDSLSWLGFQFSLQSNPFDLGHKIPMHRSGLGQIFATDVAQRVGRMGMTLMASLLEVRRRDQ
jgi:hypothetical protein